MEDKNFFQLPPSLQPFGHQTNVFEDRIWQGSSKVLVRQGTLVEFRQKSVYGKSTFYDDEKEDKLRSSYQESGEVIMIKTLRGEGTKIDRENTEKYLAFGDIFTT